MSEKLEQLAFENASSLEPAAKALGLEDGDYVWIDADPTDRPYRDWKPNTEALKISPSETAFYWRFYVPMMEAILRDAEGRR